MRSMLLALLAATAIATHAQAKDVTVAVTAIVEHPALDAARDGVKDALAEAGFKEGENLKFVYQSAQGNPATAAQIARQFVGEAPDVIVPISTPSAQAVVSATRDIPIVFTAVSDPVGAQLVKDMTKPGGNVTGLSDMSPVVEHIKLIKEVMPNIKKLGYLYNSGETNSVSLLAALKEAASAEGIEIVESAATKSAEVQGAARALVGRADAMYVPTDNTIVSALESAVGVAEESKLPLFTADTDSVKRGALAALGFNYYDVGKQTGAVVVKILNGEKPGDIAVDIAKGTDLVINLSAAKKMGVEFPQAVIDRATSKVE
ncbi:MULTISPECIES: ABC transporter substrate-binding protein [Ochrobactrum]|jgi:putative ABC transport system substrate-binding protein|uniref:ABC transporter substrate-binding protein n=1 Tax=Ochrobactrum quorumnocens TaxID=271865 RepID=A0A248UH53_9HYPH|nr:MULTISPECIES: ABC transporter substrate-binding protein [Brucella/Ochrobactrum group]MBD7991177.1 ABC transporter substrate-binding protein [Ochrobactrum gallinarum]ASV85952.1 putative ABC transporter, substrate-binding protein [[Ochrobactrum] quorumnocens]KAA9369276.1 ABC transporter substrate-binding protein [[Ochrobactrum] quorumnocens]MCV9906124.1 ABC transporter substrate-binding protein [Brucella sp. HL-2]MDH7790309.1 putative ABC transport system substrate-binding protein [Ochrobactr